MVNIKPSIMVYGHAKYIITGGFFMSSGLLLSHLLEEFLVEIQLKNYSVRTLKRPSLLYRI